jgi:predicted dehydrogenase
MANDTTGGGQPMEKKLRVACYGANGHQIVGKLAGHKRAELVAVAEISPDSIEKNLGAAASKVRQEPNLDALITAPDVDLISLCSPRRDEQFDHAVRCLRAGKHVLAEKPAVLTIEDLEELHAVMRTSKAHFRQMGSTGEERILEAMRKVVEQGRIGEVVQLYAMKSYPYHEGRPQDVGVDGGLIRQAGIHGVRFMQLATGLRATRVCGLETRLGNRRGGGLVMAASVALEFENGAVGALLCNYLNPPGIGRWGNEQFRVMGTDGMLEAVDGFTRHRMVIGKSAPEPIPDVADSFPDFFDSYVDFLLDGTPMPYSMEDDMYALRTVIRAQNAVDAGRILDV